MRKSRCALVALVALVLPVLSGCEIRPLTVEIFGWDAHQVQGVWLWRWNTVSKIYERDNGVQFLRDRSTAEYAQQFPQGTELVVYTFAMGSTELPARLERDPADPDRVKLRLWYLRFSDSGSFRATTYNAAGESELSPNSIVL